MLKNRILLAAALVRCFTLGWCAAEAPEEILLDPCDGAAGWELDTGREFPGAAGELGVGAIDGRNRLRVDFDFAKGGRYVGAARDGDIPETQEFQFSISGTGFGRGMVRFRDATGQEFLDGFKISGDGWTRVRLPITPKTFTHHWGGANDGKIHWPLNRLLIAASAPGRGHFLLRDVTILTADAAARWRLSFTTPEPGNIGFVEESPPSIIISGRNNTGAMVDAELRCAITRDDGVEVFSRKERAPIKKWELREWRWPLPSSEPGHYRVLAELTSDTNILARCEGAIGMVHRPSRFASDDPDSFFGLHVNDPAAAARIGVKWTRVFRQWRWIEGTKGHFFWPDEVTIDAARAMSMRVMVTLDAHPPAWAEKGLIAPGQSLWPYPEALLEAYGRYIREAARQYRDKIDVFEIQNEPDLSCWRHGNLQFETGVESYVRLATTAAAIIREEALGHPIAGVDVSGGDYDYGLQYSRSALAKAGTLFDIFTGHPYASPRYFGDGLRPLLPHENRETEKLRESLAMIAALGGKQRVWVGEKGWGLDVREPSHGPHSFAFAECVAQALATARSVAGVERYFWFLQHGCNESGHEYGLWRGSPRQPLPAAVAYATTASFLDHVTPDRTLRLPGGLIGLSFASKEPDRGVVVLWATDENYDLMAKWPEGARACGLMGRECALSPLRITTAPVFVTVPAGQLRSLCAAIEQSSPQPTVPVRIEAVYLITTRRLAARVQNRKARPLEVSVSVGGKSSTPRPVDGEWSGEVAFDLAESVRRLGWKTVPADFHDGRELIASRPLILNLRHCPRRTIGFEKPLAALGKPSMRLEDRWRILPPDPAVGWGGTNDLSADVWWGHDTNCFYFAALVTDDVHCPRSRNATDASRGDSLVLAFDGANDAGEASGYDANDTEIICTSTESGPKIFLTHPEKKPLEISCIARRDGSNTLYRLAIPWAMLRITPSPGHVFGFNFIINDDDGAGRAYWMGPKPGIAEVKRPGLFMDVFLEEK